MLWLLLRRHSRPAVLVGLLALLQLHLLAAPARADVSFESGAPYAILIDVATGSVLYEKAADAPVRPAGMTKLATLALLFDEIKAGRLTLTDQMTVGEDAWRRGGAPSGGTAMRLIPGARPTVEDLIRGITVMSGNDAAITVAESISGSERLFAEKMTARMAEIGLKGTVFRNATGYDDPEQRSTVRDLARIGVYLLSEHGRFYPYFAEPEFTWNKTLQKNRNGLLELSGLGADGLLTGSFEDFGFGVVGSAQREGRRLIVAIHGAPTLRDRNQEASALLEWGFRNFEERTLFEAGTVLGEAKVHGGAAKQVPLETPERLRMILPRGNLRDVSVEIVYREPLFAPLRKGDAVATLEVKRKDSLLSKTPLVAATDVDTGSLPQRAFDTFWAVTVDVIRAGFAKIGAY